VLEADRLERRRARTHECAAWRVDGWTHGRVIGRTCVRLKRSWAAAYADHMPDPKTEEMQLEQLHKERVEREQANEAPEPADEHTHERRADRAAYLRDKLDERAKSEDESA
jgi:hypothetical protein